MWSGRLLPGSAATVSPNYIRSGPCFVGMVSTSRAFLVPSLSCAIAKRSTYQKTASSSMCFRNGPISSHVLRRALATFRLHKPGDLSGSPASSARHLPDGWQKVYLRRSLLRTDCRSTVHCFKDVLGIGRFLRPGWNSNSRQRFRGTAAGRPWLEVNEMWLLYTSSGSSSNSFRSCARHLCWMSRLTEVLLSELPTDSIFVSGLGARFRSMGYTRPGSVRCGFGFPTTGHFLAVRLTSRPTRGLVRGPGRCVLTSR